MIQLLEGGRYLVNGTELVESAKAAAQGLPAPEEAAKQTIAYGILESHNTSGNMKKLQIMAWLSLRKTMTLMKML